MNETIKETEALIHELNETRETLGHIIDNCKYVLTEAILAEPYRLINAKLEENKNILNRLKSKENKD